MVAGAALAIQGIAIEDGQPPLTPLEMRRLLAETGTAQDGGLGRRIGSLPDLRAAITRWTGDVADWAPRRAKGMDALVARAKAGIMPAMPPMGHCGDCTDDELESGQLPDFLLQQKEKLFGLTIAPDRLREIRKERRALGRYSTPQQVRFELREADKIFRRYDIPNVDTTRFSIEEISSRILDSTGVERRVRP